VCTFSVNFDWAAGATMHTSAIAIAPAAGFDTTFSMPAPFTNWRPMIGGDPDEEPQKTVKSFAWTRLSHAGRTA
jgi:hypothetical protein